MDSNDNLTALNDERFTAASSMISSAVSWSAAAGVIPLPIVDSAALATVQAKMIADLSNLYGQSIQKEVASGVVSVLLGALLPASATSLLFGSGIKAIPGAGTVLGMVSMAGFGAAATYAIGKVFVRHFENGGTITSFNADAIKGDLKAEFAKATGKRTASAS